MHGRHRWMHWVLRDSAGIVAALPCARGRRVRTRPSVLSRLPFVA